MTASPEESGLHDEARAPHEDTSSVGRQDHVRVDFRAVARVAKRTELLSVRLLSCHAECAAKPGELDREWFKNAFVGYRARVARAPGDDRTFLNEMSFIAMYMKDVDFRVADPSRVDESADPDVVLEVAFELAYQLVEDAQIEDGDLDHFALANSTLHAWPYWREIGQSVSTRMGIPPMVIGTYKMPSAHDPD